jgi:hypothetical protein
MLPRVVPYCSYKSFLRYIFSLIPPHCHLSIGYNLQACFVHLTPCDGMGRFRLVPVRMLLNIVLFNFEAFVGKPFLLLVSFELYNLEFLLNRLKLYPLLTVNRLLNP